MNDQKIGLIVQARMGSERFPGKVMMPMPFPDGEPIIGRIVNSLEGIFPNGMVIVATSEHENNRPLIKYCDQKNVNVIRGSESDVLSRFVQAQKLYQFDHIVRLTGDNPVIDSGVLKEFVVWHISNSYDYSSTTGLPLGMNFEVFKGPLLDELAANELSDDEKEHVTLFFKGNRSIKIGVFPFQGPYEMLRLTVDTAIDYLTVSAILNWGDRENISGLRLIDNLIDRIPWILDVNSIVNQRNPSVSSSDELDKAVKLLQNFGYNHASKLLSSIEDTGCTRR